MNRKILTKKIIAFILGSAIMLQGGFVLPAFAASWDYVLQYNELYPFNSDTSTPEINPVMIVPDSELVEGKAYVHPPYPTNTDTKVTENTAIPDWGPDPYRIIGYTFDGWYTHKDDSIGDTRQDQKIEKDTPITASMLDKNYGALFLYGYWSKWKSPHIADNSLIISSKNSQYEKLNDVILHDAGGVTGFKRETFEYWADVYANNQYLTLDFEQYEPADGTVVNVTFNDDPVALDDSKTKELKVTGYKPGSHEYLEETEVVKGIQRGTVEDSIELQPGDNTIKIYIQLPEVQYIDEHLVPQTYQAEQTYTIHINRINTELRLNYGNTPFGEIMRERFLTLDERYAARDQFELDNTYALNNQDTRYYSPKAWSKDGTLTEKVIKGSTPSANEYLNYDEDDTAIVVYAGNKFEDPGFVLYDNSGTELSLSAYNVTRTINLPVAQTATLNGTALENQIFVPQDTPVGVYNINYKYTYNGKVVQADRKMIVLPKPGDLNLDGYVNSLDSISYNKSYTPSDSLEESLYYYRALDLNYDAQVDSVDKDIMVVRDYAIPYYYRDLSVYEAETQQSYTKEGNHAELYMDFLGKDASAPSATEVDKTTPVDVNDIIWVGYKFKEIEKSSEFANGLYSMTISVDYDSRYIEPYSQSGSTWADKVKAASDKLSTCNLSGITDPADTYKTDKSMALVTGWDSEATMKTAVLDIYAAGSPVTIGNDEYIAKIPFRIKAVPEDNRKVISTSLSANRLNMSFGTDGFAYESLWDTSKTLVSTANNMLSRVDYMGDYIPNFESQQIDDLGEYKYGEYIRIRNNSFNNEDIRDASILTNIGLTYTSNLNQIEGYPLTTGEFTFYIGGTKYKLTINETDLTVTPDDKTKIYGEANPALTMQWDGWRNGDTLDTVIKTIPSISTTADATTDYDPETKHPITLTGGVYNDLPGSSTETYDKYYNLVLKTGNLIVDRQRQIKITAIDQSVIPALTATNAGNGNFVVEGTADSAHFTAELATDGITGPAVVNSDNIKISFKATYGGETNPNVTITDIKLVTDDTAYPKTKNYAINTAVQTDISGTGTIVSKSIARLQLNGFNPSYNYGETFDFSGISLIIRYDNRTQETVNYADFASKNIKMEYVNAGAFTGKTPNPTDVNNEHPDINIFGEASLRFYIPGFLDKAITTSNFDIQKKDLNVYADKLYRTYGDNNSGLVYTYSVNQSDLATWDQKSDAAASKAQLEATGGLTAPNMKCETSQDTEVGVVSGAVKATKDEDNNIGVSYNYNIIPHDGDLEITKRQLTLTAVDPNTIPPLRYENWSTQSGPLYTTFTTDVIAGTLDEGETATATISNIYSTDKVKVSYRAVYPNNTPTVGTDRTSGVKIDTTGASMVDAYGKSKNYTVLINDTNTYNTGRVFSGIQLEKLVIDEDALKTEYEYGEYLDLDTKVLWYKRDNVDNLSDAPKLSLQELIDNYSTYAIRVYYTDNGVDTTTSPTSTDRLKVKDKKTIKIIYDDYDNTAEEYQPTLYNGTAQPIDIPITIKKAPLTVTADSKERIYGESNPAYTYSFDNSQFKFDDAIPITDATQDGAAARTSSLAGWNEPEIFCNESSYGINAVNSKTPVGYYDITFRNAEADNYSFTYVPSKMYIAQRPVHIKNVLKIPSLSSENVYKYSLDSDKDHLTFETTDIQSNPEATTDNKTLEYETGDIVTGDTLGIKYKARYTDTEVSTTAPITVDTYDFDYNNYPVARNYYFAFFNRDANIGTVIRENLTDIKITEKVAPVDDKYEDKYKYGDKLDLTGFKATLIFDSTRKVEDIDFADLGNYNVKITYTGTNDVPKQDEDVTIDYHDGKTYTLTYTNFDGTNVTAETKTKLVVTKRPMHVTLDDSTAVYGTTPTYSFKYQSSDFADLDAEDKEESTGFKNELVAPVIEAKDGTGAVIAGTEVGTYYIGLTNTPSSHNYDIQVTNNNTAELKITKRKIKIASIDTGVKTLTRADIIANKTATEIKYDSEAYNDNPDKHMTVTGIEGDSDSGVFGTDTIGIKYKTVYDLSDTTGGNNKTVSFEYNNSDLIITTTKASNYEIVDPMPTSADIGSIENSIITKLVITENPKLNYNYGEGFKLSGQANIIYNYDEDDPVTVSFTDLADYDIKATFDNGEELTDGKRINPYDHGGSHINLTLTGSDPLITAKSSDTDVITFNKHKMRIMIEPKSVTYGDASMPQFTFHYNDEDVVNGDTIDGQNFKNGLIAPVLSCVDEEGNAITTLNDVGDYEITGEGASSPAYDFVYVTDNLTINKKPIDIVSIDSGVNPLTSKQILLHYPLTTNIVPSTGSSDNESKHITVSSSTPLVNDDTIGITYDAEYTSVDKAKTATVNILNAAIDESYSPSSKNYVINSCVATSPNGSIMDREIESIRLLEQPVLEYTYGEKLNLNSGKIEITYDDGWVEQVRFNELPSDRVKITYKNNVPIGDWDNPNMLTVRDHNKNVLVVTVTSPYKVPALTTDILKVNKKTINVDIHDVTSTYGDPIEFTYDFRESDFVNGEYKDHGRFTNGLIEPKITCTDSSGRQAGSATNIGVYTINASGAEASNYKFEYHSGKLTIERRKIDINSIDSGIPMLTAKYIHQHTAPYVFEDCVAINTDNQMTAQNVVNSDSVKIKYTATYNTEIPGNNVTVGISDVRLDDDYIKNNNYELVYTPTSSSNGKVNDSNIEAIRVVELPQMEYEYGDRLNLNAGKLEVTFDNEAVEIVPFTDLASYSIDLTYSGNKDIAHSNDILDLSYNNQNLELTVNNTIYTISKVTSSVPLTVKKRKLYYGECSAEKIVYDGHTTATNGVVEFANPVEGENPVISHADFNFETTQAGEQKVFITNIVLDPEFTNNYELASDSHVIYSEILPADTDINTVNVDDVSYEFSPLTNTLTITAPELPEEMAEGGAEYEYSIDNGETWQKENLFENLELGQECKIAIRYADTNNYNASSVLPIETVNAFKVKFALISLDKTAGDEEDTPLQVLTSFYTNVETVETEKEFKEDFIGEITEIDENGEEKAVTYYTLYSDEEGKTKISFPLSFIPEGETTADVTVYTTLIQPRRSSGGGGGGGGGGSSLVLKFKNDDGTEGDKVPSTLEITTDTKTLPLIGSTDATNAELVWKSDNEKVATVDNGVVTILDKGRAVISVYAKNNRAMSDIVTLVVSKGTGATPAPTTNPSATHTPTPTNTPVSDAEMNIPYMSGFDGMIKPDDYMTRAEAATIMVKLAGKTDEEYENKFPDVKEDAWYYDIIAEASARGLIAGFDDGNFYPEETVTREQFTAMVTRLIGLEKSEGTSFTDVEPYRWSAGNIAAAAEMGIVAGYSDGTFRPENPVRRSEAARIANVATGRVYDHDYLDSIPCSFTDLSENHWAYYEFIIASEEFKKP